MTRHPASDLAAFAAEIRHAGAIATLTRTWTLLEESEHHRIYRTEAGDGLLMRETETGPTIRLYIGVYLQAV